MFTPKYAITNQLLANIKKIYSLVQELNNRRFPKIALAEFEKTARELSTHASTSIEGNPLPLTEVKKLLKSKPENIRDSEREILNYNQALTALDQQLKKDHLDPSLDLILDIHGEVTAGLLPTWESGQLRRKPVVIQDPRSGKIVYIPPNSNQVDKMIQDLMDFVDQEKTQIDPLIIAGIFHKQMVLIHPFMDGNGRTTRLATKVVLANMGLNTFNLFSFENYYNQNVTKYFLMVGEYGDYYEIRNQINFTNWLEYFTAGIIDELLRVSKLLPTIGKTPDSKLEHHHQTILKYIRQNGFIADRDYAKLTPRAKPTRAQDFRKLINLGLIERKGGGRSTYYILKTPKP